MLNNRTSQNPIVFRSCPLGSVVAGEDLLTGSSPMRESVHPAGGSHEEMGLWTAQILSTNQKPVLCRPVGKPRYPQAALPNACRALPRWRFYETFPSISKSGHPCARP